MADFTIAVDPRARIAILTWSAEQPTIELSRAAMEALCAHHDFDASFGVISDWRLARLAPEPVFVQQFLGALEGYRLAGAFTGRWATIVPNATALYGMARMTESLSAEFDLQYGVFEHLGEAMEWAQPH